MFHKVCSSGRDTQEVGKQKEVMHGPADRSAKSILVIHGEERRAARPLQHSVNAYLGKNVQSFNTLASTF